MTTTDGWRIARKSWLCGCGCGCGHPDTVIPAGDSYFVCDGVRYCGGCARAHVVGRCAELLTVAAFVVGELA